MRSLQSSAGSISGSETQWEAGDPSTPFEGQEYYRELINRANSVPLTNIFSHYGIKLDAHRRMITCPFLSHKGGKERTASFEYYPHTNTFHCHGCKAGAAAIQFVQNMENCSKVKAAQKILELFSSEVDVNNIFDAQAASEKLEIMMDFSKIVREFLSSHNDNKSRVFIEYMCSIYDNLNLDHKDISNEAHRNIILRLKEKIENYDQRNYTW